MKVVMITTRYPLRESAIVGGVQGVCYYLAQAFRKYDDVNMQIVAAYANVEQARTFDSNGITVHAIPAPYSNHKYANILWGMRRAIWNKLRELNYDLIHIQGSAMWAAKAKEPCVLTIHGINERDILFRGSVISRAPRYLANKLTEVRARKKVRNVIAISPVVRRFLDEDKQRIWDIGNPVAESFFEVERQPVAGRILYAGHISRLKNIQGLIAAFASVAKENGDWNLRIAGDGKDGEYGRKCWNLAKSLGLKRKVHFLGSLSIEQMQQELSMAHCLVLCSMQETAPLAISEAMAAGVPVVASNICGIPYMVEEGQTGRLVDPKDVEDIARGLRRLLQEDNLSVMSERAKRLAEQRYRASLVARRTYEVYKQILAESSVK